MSQDYKPGQMLNFTARDKSVMPAEFRGWFSDSWGVKKACVILRNPGECPCQIDCDPKQLSAE